MLKNNLTTKERQKSPPHDLNNISNIRNYFKDEQSDDIFSNSDIPSFSSDETEKIEPKRKRLNLKSANQTISTLPFTQEKNCGGCTPNDSTSIMSRSKQNLKVSEHIKISTFNSKFTLEGVSNKTCSCVTNRSKSRFHASDSQFPSTYNDINSLTEEQIQEIIRQKMELLDKYNEKILKKKNCVEFK